MPIILIWNNLAVSREDQFKRWLAEMKLAAGLIGSWLGKRLSESEKTERDTRGFPIFRFYNLALTGRISTFQHAALVTEPVPGLAGNMQAVAGAWRLTDEWSNRAREARLIGDLMNVLEEMTSDMLASIDRFATPSAEMFNPENARASDLIGLGALAFRTVGGGRVGIFQAFERLDRALNSPVVNGSNTVNSDVLGEALTDVARADEIQTPLTTQLDGIQRFLDEGLRYIAGAILILPALGLMMMKLGKDLIIWMRLTLINELFSLEQKVFDMRQNLLISLRTEMHAFAQTAVEFLVLARDYAIANLQHWADFGVAYLEGLVDGVGAFMTQFGTFWNGVNDLIQTLMTYTDRIMAIDLGEVIHAVLVLIENTINYIDFNFYSIFDSPTEYNAPSQRSVGIGELVLNENNGAWARGHLSRSAELLRAALQGASGIGVYAAVGSHFAGMNFFGMINGVNNLLPRLNRTPLDPAAQPVLRYSSETEPDLVGLIVTPMRDRFTASLTDIATASQLATEGIVDGLVNMLNDTSNSFRAAALNAVRFGSLSHFRRLVAGSEALVQTAFPDAEENRPTGFEAVGQAFAAWLQGGFSGMGAIISGYIGFLLNEWQQHVMTNSDTPVDVTQSSPRILLERARLGRVHLEKMSIVVGAQTSNQELAIRVARGFKSAIRNAYVTGQDQFNGFRTTAAQAVTQ